MSTLNEITNLNKTNSKLNNSIKQTTFLVNIPIFIMLVGLPASGKSTLAKQLEISYDANIHSSDEIRKELGIED